jgi:hypothetical protein
MVKSLMARRSRSKPMLKLRQVIFGIAAASAIALLPMAPAMAGGHGFGHLRPFGLGRGVIGAAVALATLPLVIASAVVSSATESATPYPAPGYAGAGYGYAPQVSYAGQRPYYAAHPGNYGHGYYRAGGNSYPHR